ncbi:MAG: 60S acidic ribosomal P0 [Lasallia pustulata]|uniref:60S acidic ribosomal P0 n=1 Tax=Lasallia pustulata TaxID=136370 RepID=A0A5M8PI92_9LECA|nr:MAG: 60S acidic ribosomal P0 [Lasallia pustulata]
MPKSKRAKVVHLSKTTKKGKPLTLKLFANIRSSISTYPYIFVFAVDNMRNTYLKDVRTDLSDSRLFFGKTKITSYFASLHPLDYARAGTTAPRTFALPAGTLYSRGGAVAAEEDVPLSATVEATLRKLGVPTRLVKGRVELEAEYVVCREGEVLGARETSLLKMFGVAMAEFGVEIRAWWSKDTGEVTVVEEGEGGEGMDVEVGGS